MSNNELIKHVEAEQQELNTFEKLQSQINQLMQKQFFELAKGIQEVKEEVVQSKELAYEYKQQAERNQEMELKKHRVTEHRFGYVSLSDLGQMFNVSIGSKTMGKLLRLVGIAKTKQSKTEPYRYFIVNGYAKSEMYGEYSNYKYNPEKCIGKIETWLNENNYLEEFYSIDDESELTHYITELCTLHGI